MRLRHSAVRQEPTTPTLRPRTPDSAYDRCEECGTDAGQPCYDSQDRPCAPCVGRVLASTGAELVDASKRLSKRRRPAAPKVTEGPRCACGRPAPDGETCGRRICRGPLACWWCGVSLKGRRLVVCGSAECARARRRAAPVVCEHCGVETSPNGRRPGHRVMCGNPSCQRARKTDHMRRSRAALTPPADTP